MTRMSSFDETCSFLPSQAARRWWGGAGRLCRAGADMAEPPRSGRARAGCRLAGTLRLLINIDLSDGSHSTAGETIPFVRAMALVRGRPAPAVGAGPVLYAGAAGSGKADRESSTQILMPNGACAAAVKINIRVRYKPPAGPCGPRMQLARGEGLPRGVGRLGSPPSGPYARPRPRACRLANRPAAALAPHTELRSNAAGAAVHRAGVYFRLARGNIFARLNSVSL